jgi:hypothetical protein
MEYVIRRSNLLLGLVLSLVATALVVLAVSASPASASSPFCGGQQVNNSNKCWGASRNMEGANAYGTSTGVCVGADLTQGQCGPTLAIVDVYVPYGNHAPWIIGTGSNFTTVYGEAF